MFFPCHAAAGTGIHVSARPPGTGPAQRRQAVTDTGPGGWADNRKRRKIPSSRVAVTYTSAGPSTLGSTVGSITSQSWTRKPRFATWKRLAPEFSKIAISEGLWSIQVARPGSPQVGAQVVRS